MQVAQNKVPSPASFCGHPNSSLTHQGHREGDCFLFSKKDGLTQWEEVSRLALLPKHVLSLLFCKDNHLENQLMYLLLLGAFVMEMNPLEIRRGVHATPVGLCSPALPVRVDVEKFEK